MQAEGGLLAEKSTSDWIIFQEAWSFLEDSIVQPLSDWPIGLESLALRATA